MKKSRLFAALASASFLLSTNFASAAWTQTILHAFNGTDGHGPSGELVSDGKGHLFGTTFHGGTNDHGVVYELTAPKPGFKVWAYKIVYSFDSADGAYPIGTLTIDAQGNLYGTTANGGASDSGTVFKLSPPPAGKTAWTETVLLSLGGTSGVSPASGLLLDKAGNIYGAARVGGKAGCNPTNAQPGCGTIFKLTPPAAGKTAWTHTTLHSFAGTDGLSPAGDLAADADGNIYGTTTGGGPQNYGTAFRLSPATGKIAWTLTTLLYFNGTGNGKYPAAGLAFDKKGNLFGTTEYGGANNAGVVFELAKPAPGSKIWNISVPLTFKGANGDVPLAPLMINAAGIIYGTTQFGGTSNGVVFSLAPPTAGRPKWLENVIYSFPNNLKRGAFPDGGVVAVDKNLVGTTYNGGIHGYGVVYSLTN